jgi:hypothetical protein
MIRSILATLAMIGPAWAGDPPAIVHVSTSMATDSRQIRQFSFDGDASTFFASSGKPRATDHFTLVLDRPVAIDSVAVDTGRPDGGDRLDDGLLEVSADGRAFEEIARFSGGSARAETKGRAVRAIRLRPGCDMGHPLAIREITLGSVEKVPTFRYPIEFAVDVADAPDMKEWADNVAGLCERWNPRICEALHTDGDKPPTSVTIVLSASYKGVAMAGGGQITGSVKYFKAHPDDLGAMIHETVHIVQRYRGRGNPSWLGEGVADYYRFFVYEPGKAGPVNPTRAHYHDSYRTTATFLAYLIQTYDKQIVFKLHRLMREGRYQEAAFQEITGKSVQELGEEWLASLRK